METALYFGKASGAFEVGWTDGVVQIVTIDARITVGEVACSAISVVKSTIFAGG